MDSLVRIGKQMPRRWEEEMDALLSSSGSRMTGAYFLGLMFVVSVILFVFWLIVFLNVNPFNEVISTIAEEINEEYAGIIKILLGVIGSLILVLLSNLSVVSYYSLKADARRAAIESILPDFLSLVSSNVRSGMPLDQALWQAGKPEFGVLGREVREAIKEAFSGKPLGNALIDLGNKFNSLLFKRILEILRQSIRSGGQIAVVLEKTANEAREIFIIKKEIQTQLLVYVIFLLFASALGVPFLFAVSQKMLEVLVSAFSMSEAIGEVSGSTLAVSKPPIEPQHFYYFSLLTIFISVIISALIIGAAYTGNKRDGLKYLPFMLVVAYIVFFAALNFLSAFFQGLIV